MIVYTDGACSGNPGPGAWAFYIPEIPIHKVGGLEHTTNNETELIAIREALKWVWCKGGQCEVTVYSDSEWAVRVLIGQYQARSHLEIVDTIMSIRQHFDFVHFKWVAGHSSGTNVRSRHNNTVDALARQEAQRIRRLVK